MLSKYGAVNHWAKVEVGRWVPLCSCHDLAAGPWVLTKRAPGSSVL